jgi:hypothetical protein
MTGYILDKQRGEKELLKKREPSMQSKAQQLMEDIREWKFFLYSYLFQLIFSFFYQE